MDTQELQLMKQVVQYVENDNIAIKPTCELLGIEYKRQAKIIKDDFVLNQLSYICTLTGADGKKYKMISLSKAGFLRWINGINIKKVSENAQENLIKMQLLIAQYIYQGEKLAKSQQNYIIQLRNIENQEQECRDIIGAQGRKLKELKKIKRELLASDPAQLVIEFDQTTPLTE